MTRPTPLTRSDINIDTAANFTRMMLHCHIAPRKVSARLFDQLIIACDTEAYQKAVAALCIAIHDAINS